MTDPEIVQRVVSLAKRNPTWGYDKLVGVFAHVGIKLSRSTVKRILDDHGIVPEPNRRVHVEWGKFVAAHQNVVAATDFFSVELLTPEGLQRCMVLFVIDIGTRRVEIAGVHTNPDGDPRTRSSIWQNALLFSKDDLFIRPSIAPSRSRRAACCSDKNALIFDSPARFFTPSNRLFRIHPRHGPTYQWIAP